MTQDSVEVTQADMDLAQRVASHMRGYGVRLQNPAGNSITQMIARHCATNTAELTARVAELEAALRTIRDEAARENGGWVHLKRCISVQARAILKEQDAAIRSGEQGQ